MTFAEFRQWCDDRWHDGKWGPGVAILCITILEDMKKERWWKRKKRWAEINENNDVYNAVIKPVNALIQEYNVQMLNDMLDKRAESAHTDKEGAV